MAVHYCTFCLPGVRAEIPARYAEVRVHRRENWKTGPMTFKIQPAGLRVNYCDTTEVDGHHRDNYYRILHFQVKSPSAIRNAR